MKNGKSRKRTLVDRLSNSADAGVSKIAGAVLKLGLQMVTVFAKPPFSLMAKLVVPIMGCVSAVAQYIREWRVAHKKENR